MTFLLPTYLNDVSSAETGGWIPSKHSSWWHLPTSRWWFRQDYGNRKGPCHKCYWSWPTRISSQCAWRSTREASWSEKAVCLVGFWFGALGDRLYGFYLWVTKERRLKCFEYDMCTYVKLKDCIAARKRWAKKVFVFWTWQIHLTLQIHPSSAQFQHGTSFPWYLGCCSQCL